MTNEEAIIILEAYKQRLVNSVSIGLDRDIEAYDMAISALQENPKLIKEAEKWQAYFEDEVANEW